MDYLENPIMSMKPTYEELEQRVKALEKEVAKHSHTVDSLQYSEKEKTAILNATMELVVYLDTNLKVIWANKTAGESLGLTSEKLRGCYCYELWCGTKEPPVECPAFKALQTGQHQKNEITTSDGKCWIHTGYPIYNNEGVIVGIVTTVLEITDRKRAEEALRTSEEKYRTQFEEALDAIFIGEAETGIIVDCNYAATALVGRAKSEILGKHQSILHPTEEVEGNFSRTYKQHIGDKTGHVLDDQVITKDGVIRDVSIKANLFEINGKRFIQGIFRDITERKQFEKKLQSREVELEEQANNLHEVNTALKVLLKQRAEDKNELEEKVLSNVQQLVVPYLQRLKNSVLDSNQRTMINVLASNLDNIVSSFTSNLSLKSAGLTPMEIRTADLVKEGKTNKEIGDILCLSANTVKFHRYNLRTKLGLKNKKINLRSHLLSLLK